ncbi:hypothetical protein CDAR_440621 [Caerostris darwini]|uniref:Uncharacterized protein n=1 Tax=Caerostris darwini TaxID=1538125 RepID=A0AAV4URS8_9ARAC|nr:hypothetical protein CDAR_440621 [Caerostris darwini]
MKNGSLTIEKSSTISQENASRIERQQKVEMPCHRRLYSYAHERAETVARFCLTTSHNYQQAYLHHIGLPSDEICPLCRIANMDNMDPCGTELN